MIYAKKKNIYI